VDRRVRFEPGQVKALCRTAPECFTQLARNPARSVMFGGNAVVFAPDYGSPFVSDLDGGRRYSSLTDFESFVKLAYMSPWLHHSGGTVCEPVEILSTSGISTWSMRTCERGARATAVRQSMASLYTQADGVRTAAR
jgi:trimethylamine:corrinoid methyltransferase-like protein